MKTTSAFSSALAAVLVRYLELKRALGRAYTQEQAVLQSLDDFLGPGGIDLTADTFTRWCQTQAHVRSGVRRNRMRIIRNFCLYRRRTEPTCFVPDLGLFPTPHQSVRPYIFSASDATQLLLQCATAPRTSNSPMQPEVLRLAIVLLYTTGLRRGELVRLTVGDYDRQEKTLRIRASKFHKSRLLPLSSDVVREVERYLKACQKYHFPETAERSLLCHRHHGPRGYTGAGLAQGLQRLLLQSGIRKPDGKPPRIHDFRHSFAVHVLVRWYHSGAELHAKLPLLATYMGYVSIVSTQYYLHFIEPLTTLASHRFAQRYGPLITPSAQEKGRPQ